MNSLFQLDKWIMKLCYLALYFSCYWSHFNSNFFYVIIYIIKLLKVSLIWCKRNSASLSNLIQLLKNNIHISLYYSQSFIVYYCFPFIIFSIFLYFYLIQDIHDIGFNITNNLWIKISFLMQLLCYLLHLWFNLSIL
jgi:hypothetical protein